MHFRSLLRTQFDILGEDNILLDSKPYIIHPVTQDEISIYSYSQDWIENDSVSNATPSVTPSASEGPTPCRTPCQKTERVLCHYVGCTSTPFRTTCDLKVHLKSHLHETLNQWSDGPKQHCNWPNCTSKAMFKSKKALQTHLENIHIDPLLCPETNCTYRGPFRSNYDLQRHIRSIHHGEKEVQFQCPFPECGDFPKTFIRRDKWLNHLRSGHDDSACPLNHCEAWAAGTQSKLVEHIKNSHGNFECGLGSCMSQPASRFAKFELMRHLEFHHGIQHGDINTAQNAAIHARDRTVRLENLPKMMSWKDCWLCSARSDIRGTQMKEVICLD